MLLNPNKRLKKKMKKKKKARGTSQSWA
jgi:hypothetical protein